ncbi:MAG: hypothetical protein JWR18_1021 [Segetibacter sp.]|nr:hypothetical protein [Segetibacter sp.]
MSDTTEAAGNYKRRPQKKQRLPFKTALVIPEHHHNSYSLLLQGIAYYFAAVVPATLSATTSVDLCK